MHPHPPEAFPGAIHPGHVRQPRPEHERPRRHTPGLTGTTESGRGAIARTGAERGRDQARTPRAAEGPRTRGTPALGRGRR